MKKYIAILIGVLILLSVGSGDELTVGKLYSGENEQKLFLEAVEAYEKSTGRALPADRLVSYPSLNDLMLALEADRVDCFAAPAICAAYVVARNEGYSMAEIDFTYYNCMAVLPENEELADGLCRAIDEMTSDGTLAQFEEEYLYTARDPARVPLGHIDGARTYYVGVTGDCPPVDLTLADGTPAGYNVAVLSEISRRLNVNFELVPISVEASVMALGTGKIDIVFWMKWFGNTAYTPGDLFRLTIPYFKCNSGFVCKTPRHESILALLGD